MSFRITSVGLPRLRAGTLARMAAAVPPPDYTLGALAEFDKEARTYQHIDGVKQVPFSLTYTGNDPAQLQARTVDATTGVQVTPWATVNVTASAGNASGVLTVQKGFTRHKLQVRPVGDSSNVLTTTSTFFVGEVVLCIGQSNMVNFPEGVYNYPLGAPYATEYRAGAFKRVGNINDSMAPNTLRLAAGAGGYSASTNEGKRGDGYVYFANLLGEALGCAVCLIELGKGGTSIDSWMTGGTSWEGASGVPTTVAAAGGDFGTVVWYQGESDSNMDSATKKARLSSLMAQCQTLTGRTAATLKFGVVSLGPVSTSSSYSGASNTKFGATRAAQVEWANSTPGAFYIGGMHDTHTSDGVHIMGEGYHRAGRRWAKSVAAAYGVGASGAGPRAVSAVLSGATVTLTIAHTGGTALLDGAGGNGSGLTGFEFKDAGGVVLPYSNPIISGPTTVQFTVASGVPATVSYAMMNAPHQADPTVATTAPILASVLYDNATYLNGVAAPFGQSVVGSPLQPFAPMTITGG